MWNIMKACLETVFNVMIFCSFRYSLMLQCWSHSADMRPSFAELVSHLESAICRKRVYVDFTSLKPDYSFPPTEQQIQVDTAVKPSKWANTSLALEQKCGLLMAHLAWRGTRLQPSMAAHSLSVYLIPDRSTDWTLWPAIWTPKVHGVLQLN